MNKLLSFKETELIINIPPKKKHQTQIVSWVNFTKHLSKEQCQLGCYRILGGVPCAIQ